MVLASEFQSEFARSYSYAREQMGIKSSKPIVGSSEDFLSGEKAQLLERKIRESRKLGHKVVFIAGPPCPDFSVAGKNRGGSGENGRLTRVLNSSRTLSYSKMLRVFIAQRFTESFSKK